MVSTVDRPPDVSGIDLVFLVLSVLAAVVAGAWLALRAIRSRRRGDASQEPPR
ncbi:MAG: hypothetical protein HY658_14105 [Actinobacteria bacterium]|nr:hypothetical protein [Actinomycetota bacterium]